jgi:hypothetical protein
MIQGIQTAPKPNQFAGVHPPYELKLGLALGNANNVQQG